MGKDALRNLLRSYGLQLFNETNDGLGFDDPKYLVRTCGSSGRGSRGLVPGCGRNLRHHRL